MKSIIFFIYIFLLGKDCHHKKKMQLTNANKTIVIAFCLLGDGNNTLLNKIDVSKYILHLSKKKKKKTQSKYFWLFQIHGWKNPRPDQKLKKRRKRKKKRRTAIRMWMLSLIKHWLLLAYSRKITLWLLLTMILLAIQVSALFLVLISCFMTFYQSASMMEKTIIHFLRLFLWLNILLPTRIVNCVNGSLLITKKYWHDKNEHKTLYKSCQQGCVKACFCFRNNSINKILQLC